MSKDRTKKGKPHYHYVYLITNKVNGKKYIGKRSCVCKIEEDTYLGSGNLQKKALKKYGKENFEKEILEICDSEKMALEKEKEYIEKYEAYDNPNFYNITKGGEGTSGNVFTKEKIEQIKQSKKIYFKNETEEQKEKRRAINRGRIKTEESRKKLSKQLKGRKKTEENIKKTMEGRKAKYGGNGYSSLSKKIICVQTKEIFDSINQAEEQTEIKNISRCLGKKGKNGKGFSTRGYGGFDRVQWTYLKEDQDYEIPEPVWKKDRKVICVTNGKVYNSLQEAENLTNISKATICNCCKKKSESAGKHPETGVPLQWSYLEEDGSYTQPLEFTTHKVKVICVTTGEIFDSMVEAETKTGCRKQSISGCCRGILKATGKERFEWKYYEDLP